MSRVRIFALPWFVASVIGIVPVDAAAQNTLGGHFGFVLPLVNHANGETTTISEDFTIGFPMGITVRTSDRIAFDLELVANIQNEPLESSLTVHPGVIVGLADRLAGGLRIAFDVNRPSWGFTPLVNYSLFQLTDTSALFAEAVIPIRFQEDAFGKGFTSVGFGVHIGVGF